MMLNYLSFITRIQGHNGVEALLQLNHKMMINSSSALSQSIAVFHCKRRGMDDDSEELKKSEMNTEEHNKKRMQQENPSQ
jgi:hypothetical protein